MPPTATLLMVYAAGMVLAGLMYVALSVATRSSTSPRAMTARRPGWIARRRARRGIRHTRGRVGVGYTSAVRAVHLDVLALNHHGYIGGAPGSGKTSLLRLLIQGYPGPVIALDTKGSPELADTVWGLPGHVWQIGSPLKLDLLDPEPAILAQQLLEGEIFTDRGIVYRAIAEHAVQRAAWVLRWRDELREPQRILELLSSPATLAAAIRQAMPSNDAMAARWLVELDSPSATIREAFQTFGERLGTLLDSPAGRSLGAGTDALRFADVLATSGKLLVQLDPRYGAISRKLGAWTLIAMLRLAAELRQARWQGRCLFVVDEPRLLEHEGRHLANLFGTARDAGLGLVVADWGIAGLSAVDRDLPDAIMRSTAWQIVLRQGSAADAEQIAAQFGTVWREDISRSSDGRTVSRLREEPRVYASSLLSLPRGSGWLRVAPMGDSARERIERVVLALPATAHMPRRLALPPGGPTVPSTDGYQTVTAAPVAPAPVDPERAAVLRLVAAPDVSGCRGWRGSFDDDGYPRAHWQGHYRRAAPLLFRWERGEAALPKGWTIDHTCRRRWCVETAHMEPLTRAEHARREAERRRQDKQDAAGVAEAGEDEGTPEESDAAADTFAIALFAGVDQPAVQPRTVSLEELARLLGRFEVLADKRRGRCWSPTQYADGATSRGNAGVASVTCLVFDCDRVPPDPERLEGVCWIGHTTWSHTPETPKWRVVIPLARPVAAKRWRDVWLRARAALCPEADPSCKDPSRQYYLPGHPAGVVGETVNHAGQLLDASTLPELPRVERPQKTRRVKVSGDRRRGEAYMDGVIRNLEIATRPGRNAALNGAAWTLGKWVAAGALEQSDVEDALHAAAVANGLVADDGDRQCWATIRSGLSAGLHEPANLSGDR